ncbi:acyl-CoA synthetase [Corynebacterium kutscheri]|uniref:Acyl-CoA synthetase n=1 Tax=Corynebacterium kutscheri TaxID=35755 RepID=A0A0F6QZM8_9CORY|nr:AMP-binding protein [Corynebacterium kutscheri]AKE41257.1 acyl-CoA synthetase (AMP-forming)/AMP-acid ligase II [Corynebacterium kutscheri]VEH08533.1 acyl-CoA synthetase [Corynebacterium kutscheri]VEH09579.1 acyl-CoA synthetase [Corynebacterium kutscheri]VEH79662.1 acyl-CoA synthetase [Corynebacterium kutscheri]
MSHTIVEKPVDLYVPKSRQLIQLAESVPYIVQSGVLALRRPYGAKVITSGIARWGFSLAFLLENAAEHSPNRTAIIDDLGEISYRVLRIRARRFAAGLANLGVVEGDKVGIIARNSRVTPITLAALAYLGVSPMIMNPMSSPAQLDRIIRSYGAKALVVDAAYVGQLRDLGLPIIIGYHDDEDPAPADLSTMEQIIDAAPLNPIVAEKPTRMPTVIMSSGTTGLPKGIVRGVPKTPQVLASILPKIPWRLHGVIQQHASLFHAWGWLNLNLVWATKSTMIVHRYFDGKQATDDFLNYEVTGIISAAIFLKDFEEEYGLRDIDSQTHLRKAKQLRFIASSGNAIPPVLVHALNRRFGNVVCNFYGSTEHGPIATASANELAADPDRAGTIARGIRVKIFREDGTEAATNEVGMVYSCNSESMVGYLSPTDEATVKDHMLGTGDLGFIDDQGFLHVRSRYDDMVIKGGENVYPRELEEFLHTLDDIHDAYVRGIRGEIMSELNAYVVRAQGSTIDEDSLRKIVADNLAQHNIPDNIIWLDKLPRNDAGKVIPRELL